MLLETAGDPLAAYAGDRGAEVFRACVACHTLGADQTNRAGPTLAGIFGGGSQPSRLCFFQALKELDIVWTPETVSKLFEIGPRPTRRAPRCRSSVSVQNRIALHWCSSWSARPGDSRLMDRSRFRQRRTRRSRHFLPESG